jgi:hypothetical protein
MFSFIFPNNKYSIFDRKTKILFNFIALLTHNYEPSKTNKKKIKELFNSMPFFLETEEEQNTLFKIIVKYPITSFYDTSESMKKYGYLLYKHYFIHFKKEHRTYEEYINDFKIEIYKTQRQKSASLQKQLHHVLFFIFILLIITFIYFIQD